LIGGAARRARRAGGLPVVVSIDVEPDGRAIDTSDPGAWDGFNRMLALTPTLRERLAAATGQPVAFTWNLRMDPQIELAWGSARWPAEHFGTELAALEAEGDVLGLHTHDWRWDSKREDWTALNNDPDWDAECLGVALDAFHSAFGRTAPVHRGGDHFLSGAMLDALRSAQVGVDLTVEPGLAPATEFREGEIMLASSPDYRGVPTFPYRSSADAFPGPDPEVSDGPLHLPLFSAPGRGGRIPLTLWKQPGRFAPRLAAQLVAGGPPVIAFALRANICLLPVWDHVEANLDQLARHRGVRFVTAPEAAAAYESGSA
jgi:hypothetical protein